ncbi:hypothetical protein D3C73_1453390 [compost metagenome]
MRDKANLTRYSCEYVLLGEQNRWLQTAAKNLIKNKRSPADPEIVELARLCMMESKKADGPGFGVVAPGYICAHAHSGAGSSGRIPSRRTSGAIT